MLAACEKDIHLDYHQVEPLYVAEASVSNTGTQVRLSTTNNMDDNSSASQLSQARITVTTSSGGSYTVPSIGNGIYRLTTLQGEPGVRYSIDIEIDDRHFTASSVMQQAPVLNSFRMVWKRVASERILFADARLQDIRNEDNWYFLHIYRNGIGYRWAVMRDTSNPNRELQQLFTFYREGSSDSDVLNEGDVLRLEVRAIDQQAYDYLYSMQLMDNTGTNPLACFTGGCLGYFSAYHQIVYTRRFGLSDVEEDDE